MMATITGVNAAAASVPGAQIFDVAYAAAADDTAVMSSVLTSMPLLAGAGVVVDMVRVAGYWLMARIGCGRDLRRNREAGPVPLKGRPVRSGCPPGARANRTRSTH